MIGTRRLKTAVFTKLALLSLISAGPVTAGTLGKTADSFSSTGQEQSYIQKVAFQNANGRNVVAAWFGPTARFQKSGGQWIEVNAQNQIAFRFQELRRDAWSVYLYDRSRNVHIQLDLYQQKVFYNVGNNPKQPLYNLTRVAAGNVNTAQSNNNANNNRQMASVAQARNGARRLPRNTVTQCVKAVFGIGYSARVNWYEPQNVIYDPVTKAATLRPGAKATKTEKIIVTQKSCIRTNLRMVATVSAVGGETANTFISIAAGTVVAAATGVAGAFVCVGTAGAGCPAAAAGVAAATGGVVSATGAALPDAGGMFYIGAPGSLEVSGTIWSPKTREVQAWGAGKPVNASCSADSQCANNTCARDSARKGNRSICCPSGREGMYAGHEYCYGLSRGKVCWSDAMCSSRNCKGNASGLKRGRCS